MTEQQEGRAEIGENDKLKELLMEYRFNPDCIQSIVNDTPDARSRQHLARTLERILQSAEQSAMLDPKRITKDATLVVGNKKDFTPATFIEEPARIERTGDLYTIFIDLSDEEALLKTLPHKLSTAIRNSVPSRNQRPQA